MYQLLFFFSWSSRRFFDRFRAVFRPLHNFFLYEKIVFTTGLSRDRQSSRGRKKNRVQMCWVGWRRFWVLSLCVKWVCGFFIRKIWWMLVVPVVYHRRIWDCWERGDFSRMVVRAFRTSWLCFPSTRQSELRTGESQVVMATFRGFFREFVGPIEGLIFRSASVVFCWIFVIYFCFPYRFRWVLPPSYEAVVDLTQGENGEFSSRIEQKYVILGDGIKARKTEKIA